MNEHDTRDERLVRLLDEARHTQGYSEGDLRSLVRSLADELERAWKQPEPEVTDEMVERMRAALDAADIDYSAREQRADAGGGEIEPGDWFTFLARAALAAGPWEQVNP